MNIPELLWKFLPCPRPSKGWTWWRKSALHGPRAKKSDRIQPNYHPLVPFASKIPFHNPSSQPNPKIQTNQPPQWNPPSPKRNPNPMSPTATPPPPLTDRDRNSRFPRRNAPRHPPVPPKNPSTGAPNWSPNPPSPLPLMNRTPIHIFPPPTLNNLLPISWVSFIFDFLSFKFLFSISCVFFWFCLCPETMVTVRNVLGRWGRKVGEATRKAESLAGNTWQHCKFSVFLFFSFLLLSCIGYNSKVGAHGVVLVVPWVTRYGNLIGILFLRKLVLELYKIKWEFDCYVFVRHGNGFSYFAGL